MVPVAPGKVWSTIGTGFAIMSAVGASGSGLAVTIDAGTYREASLMNSSGSPVTLEPRSGLFTILAP